MPVQQAQQWRVRPRMALRLLKGALQTRASQRATAPPLQQEKRRVQRQTQRRELQQRQAQRQKEKE